MNIWTVTNITLNFITLVNTILTIIICSLIFLLILIFHQRTRSIPIILAGHASLILIISACMLGSMCTSSLIGFVGIHLEQHTNTTWCIIRGFCVHAFLCALYDSYILQATYRLCRVVFYRRKRLLSCRLYIILVPIETCFSILCISPVLFQNNVIYLPTEYYCQTPFTNIRAIMYVALRLFLLPLIFIIFVHICLLKYIRKMHNTTCRKRMKQDKRHLIITRRLLFMLGVLLLLGLPSVTFLTIYLITGHLFSLTYRIGWLSVSISLVFLAYMLIQLTAPLKKTVHKILSRASTSRDQGNGSND